MDDVGDGFAATAEALGRRAVRQRLQPMFPAVRAVVADVKDATDVSPTHPDSE
jgi:hypothetical protein